MAKLYLWLAGLAITGGLAIGWYITSLKLDTAQNERAQAKAEATAYRAELEREREEVIRVNTLLSSLENKEAEIRYVDKIVKQEIVKYRDRVVNRCQLSADWLSIHNAAAAGRATDSGPGEVPDAP